MVETQDKPRRSWWIIISLKNSAGSCSLLSTCFGIFVEHENLPAYTWEKDSEEQKKNKPSGINDKSKL